MKGYGFDRLSRDVMFLTLALNVVGLVFWNSIAGIVICAFAAGLMALILFRTLSTKSICSKGSPPEMVTPPPDAS